MESFTTFLAQYHLLGLTIGVCTFLVIGLFHPLVIKGEYYFGTRCWWWFLILGIVCATGSFCIDNVLASTIAGVIAFSAFWSIKEIFEQAQRVERGWFPRNPKRKYGK